MWVGDAKAPAGGSGIGGATRGTATSAAIRAAVASTTAGSAGGSAGVLLDLVPLKRSEDSPVKMMVSPFDKIRKPCPVMSPEGPWPSTGSWPSAELSDRLACARCVTNRVPFS